MSQLPVRQVILYKHGVGYFARRGEVQGNAVVALPFKQKDVSDVLKSLTILDHGGGLVTAVSYDSTTPAEQQLAEIDLDIPNERSLESLLGQIKGARVKVVPMGSTTACEGMILGMEYTSQHHDGLTTQVAMLSVLTDDGTMRTFPLTDHVIQLLDPGMKHDLEFYLQTVLNAKKKDSRTFTLYASGEGTRELEVGYVRESPVWKATYRILLNPEQAPQIQGWAVVDNTTEEDWTEIELTLIAGLPVSFIHDLYTPRFLKRPVVEVKETSGVLPPMAEEAVMEFDSEIADQVALQASFAAAPGAPSLSRAKRAVWEEQRRGTSMSSAPSSVATQTRERQIGDLFEYTINQPVTIRRNQSALVPIVLSAFSGRSVLLYQKQARPENPMRCVEFENTTGLTLEGGPVTVLEEGRYVGEAMLDTLKPTERRLVGYAVELAVRVTDEINSYQDLVHHVIIENGVLWTHSASVRKTTYTFTSKSEKDQTLFLDHPRPGGDWQLREPAQPSEVTESMWRFKLTIAAQKTTQFVVVAASPFTQTFQLSNLTQPTLALWLQSRFIDNATEQKLKQSFDLRREISATQEKENHLHEERERLHTDQERVRNNLQALGERVSEKELRERYIRTLTQHEDRLEVIEQELLNNQKLRDELNTRLTTLLTAISWQQKL